jgi:hypothetical protein
MRVPTERGLPNQQMLGTASPPEICDVRFKMKKKLIIPIVAVPLIVAALVAVGYFGISKRSVRPDEQAFLVTVSDLRPFLPELPSTGGVFVAKRNFDGTTELEYEFDGEDVLIDSEAEIFSTVPLAQEGFRHRVMAYQVGMKASQSKARIVEAKGLFDAGSDNFAAYIQHGDLKLGNVIVTRRDKTVFALLLTGLYFDTKEDLTDVLGPKPIALTGIDPAMLN